MFHLAPGCVPLKLHHTALLLYMHTQWNKAYTVWMYHTITHMALLSQVNQSITMVDNSLGQLLDGLKDRNILDCVNVIITSDHGEVVIVMSFFPWCRVGMQFSSENTTIYLEDVSKIIDMQCTWFKQLCKLYHITIYSTQTWPLAFQAVLYHKMKHRNGDYPLVSKKQTQDTLIQLSPYIE